MRRRDVTGREGDDGGDNSWIHDVACEYNVWITVEHSDIGLVHVSRCVLNPDILPCNSPHQTSSSSIPLERIMQAIAAGSNVGWVVLRLVHFDLVSPALDYLFLPLSPVSLYLCPSLGSYCARLGSELGLH